MTNWREDALAAKQRRDVERQKAAVKLKREVEKTCNRLAEHLFGNMMVHFNKSKMRMLDVPDTFDKNFFTAEYDGSVFMIGNDGWGPVGYLQQKCLKCGELVFSDQIRNQADLGEQLERMNSGSLLKEAHRCSS